MTREKARPTIPLMNEKKSPKGPQTESHLAVVLENIRSQFKVFGEGLIDLRKKSDVMNSNIENLMEQMGDIRFRLARVEGRIDKLEESNARIEEKVSRIENDIRIIKNNIKVKVDLEEHKMLENRVVLLEKRLAALEK